MIKQKCTSEALGTDIKISVYASVEGDSGSFVLLRGYDEWFYGIYEFTKDSRGFEWGIVCCVRIKCVSHRFCVNCF